MRKIHHFWSKACLHLPENWNVPWKGTISKGKSSSNHQFPGAMFVSGRGSHRHSLIFLACFFSKTESHNSLESDILLHHGANLGIFSMSFPGFKICTFPRWDANKPAFPFSNQLTQTQKCFSKGKGKPGIRLKLNMTTEEPSWMSCCISWQNGGFSILAMLDFGGWHSQNWGRNYLIIRRSRNWGDQIIEPWAKCFNIAEFFEFQETNLQICPKSQESQCCLRGFTSHGGCILGL